MFLTLLLDFSTKVNYTSCPAPSTNKLNLVMYNGTSTTETVKSGTACRKGGHHSVCAKNGNITPTTLLKDGSIQVRPL